MLSTLSSRYYLSRYCPRLGETSDANNHAPRPWQVTAAHSFPSSGQKEARLLLQFPVLPAHLGSKAKTPWAATDGDGVGAERKGESTEGQ